MSSLFPLFFSFLLNCLSQPITFLLYSSPFLPSHCRGIEQTAMWCWAACWAKSQSVESGARWTGVKTACDCEGSHPSESTSCVEWCWAGSIQRLFLMTVAQMRKQRPEHMEVLGSGSSEFPCEWMWMMDEFCSLPYLLIQPFSSADLLLVVRCPFWHLCSLFFFFFLVFFLWKMGRLFLFMNLVRLTNKWISSILTTYWQQVRYGYWNIPLLSWAVGKEMDARHWLQDEVSLIHHFLCVHQQQYGNFPFTI